MPNRQSPEQASFHSLVRQLGDVTRRNAARKALVARGPDATPVLLAELEHGIDPDHRKTILRTLLEIGDARTEEAFRRALDADDEELRAIGARGLFLLSADDALQAQITTINDAPDSLHTDITPAVTALSQMGISVLPALLPLLAADDPRTRQRAQRALEQVTHRVVGDERRAWHVLWEENGAYRWDSAADLRANSLQRWQRWIASHGL